MLSQTSTYALRALYCIARRGGDSLVMAGDIAEEMHIPSRYLSGILRTLVQLGVLRSTRGKNGGFQLARPADKIFLVEILGPFQGSGRQTNCPFGNAECGIRNPCPIHERWSEVVATYQHFTETTTLAMLHHKWKMRRN
jgi:Rrf2 family transcriptional regulator, iron-sulfur cluster assembly transcription factor